MDNLGIHAGSELFVIPEYVNDIAGLKLAIALTSSLKMKDSSIFIRVPLPEEIVKKINNSKLSGYRHEQLCDNENNIVIIESPKTRKSEFAQDFAKEHFLRESPKSTRNFNAYGSTNTNFNQRKNRNYNCPI